MKSSPPLNANGRFNRRSLSLGLFITFGYILAFFLLFPWIGAGIASLAALPAVWFGWAWGWQAGLASSLPILLLNTLLFNAIGIQGIDAVFQVGGGTGSLVIGLLGALAGVLQQRNDGLAQQTAAVLTTQQALRQGEQHFRGLFEHSPISLWEEDFSAVKRSIDRSKGGGIRDCRAYFDAHPEVVDEMISLVKVVDVNQATLELYRAGSKAELLNNLHQVFTDESNAVFKEELITIAQGGTMFEGEGQNRSLAGEVLDLHVRWSVAPGYEDSLSKVFVSIIDITARKRAEAELKKSTARAESLVAISSELAAASLEAQPILAIIVRRAAERIGDACWLSMVSEDREWLEVVACDHPDPECVSTLRQTLASRREQVGEGAAGQVALTGHPILLSPTPSEDPGGRIDPAGQAGPQRDGANSLLIVPLISGSRVIGTLGVSRNPGGAPYTLEDQSFLQSLANQAAFAILNARLHEQVRLQARMDALTGVYNRRHFFDLAEREIQRSKRYGLSLSAIMIDLDNFKKINDSYGHRTGDQVIQAVAQRLRENIRSTEIIGRYGGEEFSILLPETDLAGAQRLGQRLCKCVAEKPLATSGGEIALTASFGIATRLEEVHTLSELLHLADEAMYAAKRAGGNRVTVLSGELLRRTG